MTKSAGCFFRLVLIAVLGAIPVAPALAQAPAPAPAAPTHEAEIDTAPVVIDGKALLNVRGFSSLPAQTRAQNVKNRIETVAADSTIDVAAVRTLESDDVVRILAGDRLLLVVTDADGRVESVSRRVLAAAHAERIRRAITEYRQARSPDALRDGAIYAAIATVLLAAVIAALVWLARRLDRLMEQRLHRRIQSVGIQSFEIVRAERIWTALRGALVALRAIAILVAVFVFLGYVLAQFPWTRPLSTRLVDLLIGPLKTIGEAILAEIPDLIFLAILFFIFRFALRLIRLFFEAVGHGTVTLSGFDADWAAPTYKIARFVLIAFGLVVTYPYIPGSNSDAFKGVSVFVGVLFSLGAASAISNIIAGYMMTYRRAFKVGDRVKIGDAIGDVTDVRLQVTHLRTPKNEELIIPNSQILTGHVVNYSTLARTQGLILHTEVGIGYETPWRQVEAMLLMAAERTPGLLKEPAPFILQKKLGDFAVNYELNVYCGDAQAMNRLYADLHRSILDAFNEYGIQIMTPAYEGDTPDAKVVPRENWYAAPAVKP